MRGQERNNKWRTTRPGMRITVFGLLLLTFVVAVLGIRAVPPAQGEITSAEPQILQKVRAVLGEDRFWGYIKFDQRDLQVVLFQAINKPDDSSFNLLVIVPEVQWTFEMHTCGSEPPTLVEGSGAPVQAVDAGDYLREQMARYSSFIASGTRADERVDIDSDPVLLFRADAAFKRKRIAQIKSALLDLLHRHKLRIEVASFSRLTDQINVLVPSLDEMYTMSIVHDSCAQESVEVGEQFRLESVRPDLLHKIKQNNEAATIE